MDIDFILPEHEEIATAARALMKAALGAFPEAEPDSLDKVRAWAREVAKAHGTPAAGCRQGLLPLLMAGELLGPVPSHLAALPQVRAREFTAENTDDWLGLHLRARAYAIRLASWVLGELKAIADCALPRITEVSHLVVRVEIGAHSRTVPLTEGLRQMLDDLAAGRDAGGPEHDAKKKMKGRLMRQIRELSAHVRSRGGAYCMDECVRVRVELSPKMSPRD